MDEPGVHGGALFQRVVAVSSRQCAGTFMVIVIREANQHGWKVFIVTNQSGIARGFLKEKDLKKPFEISERPSQFAGISNTI